MNSKYITPGLMKYSSSLKNPPLYPQSNQNHQTHKKMKSDFNEQKLKQVIIQKRFSIKQYSTFASAKNSRKHIQQQEKIMNLQFSKTARNKKNPKQQLSKKKPSKCAHRRTNSHDISNFSNSIDNISQILIQVPYRKQKVQNQMFQSNSKFFGDNSTKQIQQIVQTLDNKAKQNVKPTSFSKHVRSTSGQELKFTKRPFNIKNFQRIKISDFTIKAQNICKRDSSIIYIAQHKKTQVIYTIKSTNRKMAKRNQNLLKQMKINLFINHPSFIKTYAIFCDSQNIYQLRQFIANDYQSGFHEQKPIQEISQILEAILHILPFLEQGTKFCFDQNVRRNKDLCKMILEIQNSSVSNSISSLKSFLIKYVSPNVQKSSNKLALDFNQKLKEITKISYETLSELILHDYLRKAK